MLSLVSLHPIPPHPLPSPLFALSNPTFVLREDFLHFLDNSVSYMARVAQIKNSNATKRKHPKFLRHQHCLNLVLRCSSVRAKILAAGLRDLLRVSLDWCEDEACATTPRIDPAPALTFFAWPVTAPPTTDLLVATFRDRLSVLAHDCILWRSWRAKAGFICYEVVQRSVLQMSAEPRTSVSNAPSNTASSVRLWGPFSPEPAALDKVLILTLVSSSEPLPSTQSTLLGSSSSESWSCIVGNDER